MMEVLNKDFENYWDDFKEALEESSVDKSNRLLCECHLLSYEDVEKFLSVHKNLNCEEIMETLLLGKGCGSCKNLSQDYINQFLNDFKE